MSSADLDKGMKENKGKIPSCLPSRCPPSPLPATSIRIPYRGPSPSNVQSSTVHRAQYGVVLDEQSCGGFRQSARQSNEGVRPVNSWIQCMYPLCPVCPVCPVCPLPKCPVRAGWIMAARPVAVPIKHPHHPWVSPSKPEALKSPAPRSRLHYLANKYRLPAQRAPAREVSLSTTHFFFFSPFPVHVHVHVGIKSPMSERG